MNFFSTRGAGPVSLDEALRRGIAEDGGLYLPESLPLFEIVDFNNAESIPDVARVLLKPFFAGSVLESDIEEILEETFSFTAIGPQISKSSSTGLDRKVTPSPIAA